MSFLSSSKKWNEEKHVKDKHYLAVWENRHLETVTHLKTITFIEGCYTDMKIF